MHRDALHRDMSRRHPVSDRARELLSDPTSVAIATGCSQPHVSNLAAGRARCSPSLFGRLNEYAALAGEPPLVAGVDLQVSSPANQRDPENGPPYDTSQPKFGWFFYTGNRELVGVARWTWRRWQSGRARPSPIQLKQINRVRKDQTLDPFKEKDWKTKR
jgi:hypothetical protein